MTDNRLPLPVLTPLVSQAVMAQAGGLGLDIGRVAVEYVLNWGGFGNASFNVGDGTWRFHLKLTTDAATQEALRRWQRLRTFLEGRYHAPAMLGWLTVPGTPYQGPIFEFIAGEHLDGCRRPGILNDLLCVVGLLHADRELAEKMDPNGPIRTYLDCFRSRYIQPLREDLRAIRIEPPPFISPARLRWMSEEVDLLEKLTQESGAFGGTAHSVIHWDLWWNNILVSPSGGWFILDWDDVGFGDPAMDFSAAIFPFTCDPTNRNWQSFPIAAHDDAFSTRMDLYRRTQVLDWIIDVLVDWIDCREAPASQAEVRARKQAEHEQYLRIYEAEYRRD
jgi:hypothetical protein